MIPPERLAFLTIFAPLALFIRIFFNCPASPFQTRYFGKGGAATSMRLSRNSPASSRLYEEPQPDKDHEHLVDNQTHKVGVFIT